MSAAHLYPSRIGAAVRVVRRLVEPVVHCLQACALLVSLAFVAQALAQTDPLPSWNAGRARNAIIDFVQTSTDPMNPMFVPQEERIATFDQDGTLWVEHPIYTQLAFALDRVPAVVAQHPALQDVEPFKTVLSGDREAIAGLSQPDLEWILAATLTGMTVEDFDAVADDWLTTATHPRWHRPYTDLVYQPMLEVLQYLRANGFKTYIVTGGGQDFVRTYAAEAYGIPPEQVIGSVGATKYGYDEQNRPILMKEPKLLLNDNDAGKPEGIHFMIGRRPAAAFGNSSGDRQMLEYTRSANRPGLAMLVLHDDAEREYAYGPAEGLPDTKVGTFPQSLYVEAKKQGWVVVSMESDWKRIFAFDTEQ
ncbi:MAG TPA: HAD family hydrolase [Vicinamibacterales bacterium]|jgi:phosphoserine phosphatase|nr:HAD family hydrolase [Vicinamibacterales bacterium]